MGADVRSAVTVPVRVAYEVARQRQGDGRQADLFAREQQPDLRPEPSASDPAWVASLFLSSAYAAQRRLAGRGAPSDDQVRDLLIALAARGGRTSRTGLAQALGQPAMRIGGLVSAARRLLNLDQAQVLATDGEDVVFDERLLGAQFELGSGG